MSRCTLAMSAALRTFSFGDALRSIEAADIFPNPSQQPTCRFLVRWWQRCDVVDVFLDFHCVAGRRVCPVDSRGAAARVIHLDLPVPNVVDGNCSSGRGTTSSEVRKSRQRRSRSSWRCRSSPVPPVSPEQGVTRQRSFEQGMKGAGSGTCENGPAFSCTQGTPQEDPKGAGRCRWALRAGGRGFRR